MNLFSLAGKTAIITGSTRGIGRAIAESFVAHGAKVVVSSRNVGACEEVRADINRQYGDGSAIAIAADISSKSDLQHLVDETTRQFGKVDVLVCNAASSSSYHGPLGGIPDDDFRQILEQTSSPTIG
jgi:NAD(P)-dependent dehydrogenase (short-subunit alcohol dehydrogenase family)